MQDELLKRNKSNLDDRPSAVGCKSSADPARYHVCFSIPQSIVRTFVSIRGLNVALTPALTSHGFIRESGKRREQARVLHLKSHSLSLPPTLSIKMAHVNGSIRLRGGKTKEPSFFSRIRRRRRELSTRAAQREASTLRNGLELRNRPSGSRPLFAVKVRFLARFTTASLKPR